VKLNVKLFSNVEIMNVKSGVKSAVQRTFLVGQNAKSELGCR
jgi:hypothetical protein